MTTFDTLLEDLYLIQGTSDPNHPADSLAERMREIYEIACRAMDDSGYQPDGD